MWSGLWRPRKPTARRIWSIPRLRSLPVCKVAALRRRGCRARREPRELQERKAACRECPVGHKRADRIIRIKATRAVVAVDVVARETAVHQDAVAIRLLAAKVAAVEAMRRLAERPVAPA